MTDLDVLQLGLTISASENDDDRLDDMTRQLFMELKDLDVESIKLAADGHGNTHTHLPARGKSSCPNLMVVV